MADFNSAHTGAEIDDAVGTAKGAGTGLLAKTGTGAGSKRTITGTTDEITVTNGDGVSGNPTLSLAAAVTASLALADSATQPGDLGTAAATDATDYATAAQGALADTALQAADITDLVESDPTGVTGADAITNIMSLTQAEYDAIGSPDAATLYVITA